MQRWANTTRRSTSNIAAESIRPPTLEELAHDGSTRANVLLQVRNLQNRDGRGSGVSIEELATLTKFSLADVTKIVEECGRDRYLARTADNRITLGSDGLFLL